ncbi:hypothetical protein CVT25_002486 [Psilocybe cyanescens]|uniref:Fungal-type protein kinase domain-containing protein n=1 Tax=Psilocybe cyanescens TaxID=93625 RepID=A0A409XUJ4_PSICY|nr:hypothetical protein CVT25_002486 [Psilocybe cyanescens]
MQNPRPNIISTPSKNKTGSRSQAGNLEYKQEAIRGDLEADIRNSTKCDFDAFLKYFLSLVLKDDDPEKRSLNEIQTKIEELQLKRYEGKLAGNEDTTTGGASTDIAAAEPVGTPSAAARAQEGADDKKPVDLNDDTQFGSEEEKQLVQKRDEILDKLLNEALNAVLPVANNQDVKDMLASFAHAFTKVESARYKPFVLLCNDALSHLASLDAKPQFREKNGLDIRFHRNDPSNIKSHYEGMQEIDRKPDVAITALIAALRAASQGREMEEAFGESPNKSFEWFNIFSCIEFKKFKRGIPEEGKSVADKIFKTASSLQVLQHAVLPEMDVDEVGEPPIVAEGSGSKRARDGGSVVENPSPSKKSRQLNSETPMSSNLTPATSAAANNSNMQANVVEKNTQLAINGRVQCASYALEMMSYSAGVHHAINLLFTDGHVWIWYYDRQGIVQSDGISIFADFPRFLVLLFAFQRFDLEDWGIIRCLNPKFLHGLKNQPEAENKQGQTKRARGKRDPAKPSEPEPEPESEPESEPEPEPVPGVILNLQQNLPEFWVPDGQDSKLATVAVDMGKFLSHQPHCLSGRATSVVSAQGFTQDGTLVPTPMVCKIYHPEVERRHEGVTLQVVRKIAEADSRDMLKHLPSMLFYGDVPRCTTGRIRSMIKRRWKGHRTLRILGLKKLEKITTVDGADFIKAWLETVICHAFLWKNYVEHGDPSLSNIMYDPETKCGVLSDFDLSLLQWETRAIGTDRTGTVPFMAIDLLTQGYWEGKIQRFYHHELESFIWILAYVCLLYDKGIRKKNAAVDAWRTSDYNTCCKNKLHFYTLGVLKAVKDKVQASYKAYWPLAVELCINLRVCHLQNDVREYSSSDDDPRQASEQLWTTFITSLRSKLEHNNIPDRDDLLERLEAQKPSFERPDEATQMKLRDQYSTIIAHDQGRSESRQ